MAPTMRSVHVSSLGRGQSEVTAVSPLQAALLWACLDPPVRNVCFRVSHLCPQNRECLRGRQWTSFIVSLLPEVARGYSPHSPPPAPRGPGALAGSHRREKSAEVGDAAGSPPRVCHRRGRTRQAARARPPEDVLSAAPRAGLSQVSGNPVLCSHPRARGCPTPTPGSAVKVLVRCLGPVEAFPSPSRKCPGHCHLETRPPSVPALTGPRHAEARGLP